MVTALAIWAPAGRLLVGYVFTVTGGAITAIDRVANPGRLRTSNPSSLTTERGPVEVALGGPGSR